MRYQPESTRGTKAMRRRTPADVNAKPALMIVAGRRLPAFLPARSATANMLSESGAIERPASIALYSKTICR